MYFIPYILLASILLAPHTDDITPEIIQEDIVGEVLDDEIIEDEIIEDEPILLLTNEDSDIVAELKKSNDYWEMFLDSYEVTLTSYYSFEVPTYLGGGSNILNFSSSGALRTSNPSGNYCSYIGQLPSGHYVFDIVLTNRSYSSIGFVRSLDVGSVCTVFLSQPDVGTYHFDFYVSDDNPMFVVCYATGSSSQLWTIPLNPFPYTYSRYDSYTLSELGNAVISISDKVDKIDDVIRLLECVTFVNCMLLLVPMIRAISKKERKL